jgi:hypothetical protein
VEGTQSPWVVVVLSHFRSIVGQVFDYVLDGLVGIVGYHLGGAVDQYFVYVGETQ